MTTATTAKYKACRRYDVPGHAHYLTFSCYRCQPFLSGPLAPQWLATAIDKAMGKLPFYLWAYVFMPEHVHLLVQPIGGSEISRILWAIKWPVTKKSVRHVRRVSPGFLGRMEDVQPTGRRAYRFWQRGGGHDRNIYSDSELIEKINYTHNNPVRRGLVGAPGDWHWSSWRAWHEGVDTPIRIDRASVFLR